MTWQPFSCYKFRYTAGGVCNIADCFKWENETSKKEKKRKEREVIVAISTSKVSESQKGRAANDGSG